jgi:hypothetical protein
MFDAMLFAICPTDARASICSSNGALDGEAAELPLEAVAAEAAVAAAAGAAAGAALGFAAIA